MDLKPEAAPPRRGSRGPLAGTLVVDLSTTLAGAFATQYLADAGADVVLIEPPGGTRLRTLASWPALARGRRSVVLDLLAEADRQVLDGLVARADVLVSTFRPATSARLGLTPQRLAALNPRLVSAAITGWGSTGPLRDLKGYEGMVMAKVGYFHAKKATVTRPGPAFVSVPYASWGAGQTALHGILTALLERESSGIGQHVEADLVRGVATLDTWQWFLELVGDRWPGAYPTVESFDAQGRPVGKLILPLLIAPTKDGHWLQFAQVDPRLFIALVQELEMGPLLAEPAHHGFPDIDAEHLDRIWEYMLGKVAERTLAEWEQVFRTNTNISAELFRTGTSVLGHPQLAHDGRVVVVDDPDLGPVRQLSTLVHADGAPLTPLRPAPRLNEDADQVRAEAAAPLPAPPAGTSASSAAGSAAPCGLPLAGITVVELTKMFAAPYGATLLTDLGARVIKIEGLEGDEIRRLSAFPEASAAKVMQGKESIAVDITTDEGRQIVHDLVGRADLFLQSFRAGAVERLGLDESTLKKINPDLIYLNAPGYGTDGPFGARPAYAPSVGAAGGLALTDVPSATAAVGSLSGVKAAAARLLAASTVASLQADGVSALAVASTMLLGLLAARRGQSLDRLTTTMLATTNHLVAEWTIDYAGRPPQPTVDDDGHGLSALYRMYPAQDGWIFLAAPAEGEWAALVAALKDHVALGADERFGSAADRRAHDADLVEVLSSVFVTGPKDRWEAELTAAGVGCVTVTERAPELTLMSDAWFEAGYSTTAMSPIFDEHRRLSPASRFSRSATRADGGCMAGDHTDAILRGLGYDDTRLADLRARTIIA